MKKKSVSIITLGCPKNLVDSEKLAKQIAEAGYKVLHDPEKLDSDIVIINTCGFINDACEESIDTILNAVKANKSGKKHKIYVAGCLPQRYMDTLKAEIPEVSRYFGTDFTEEILNELGVQYSNELKLERELTGPGHFAYLKISEGCDRTCSFCAIPSIKGRYVSRPMDEIIKEAKILADKGVREIILVAQDLSYYGLDIYKRQMLSDLTYELLKIGQLEWIRLHYLYPANFPIELLQLIKDNSRICKYIDIPIQHISDQILRLMRRSHNRAETEGLLFRLREELPDAAIRTTIITGHPGETEKEFRELCDFVADFRFDRLGVFAYSHEEGTYSYQNYKDGIPARKKSERVSKLMEIQQSISVEKNHGFVGKRLKTIIDRREGDYFIGRSEYDSPEIDQEIIIEAGNSLIPGHFYDILITGSSEYDLFGYPVL